MKCQKHRLLQRCHHTRKPTAQNSSGPGAWCACTRPISTNPLMTLCVCVCVHILLPPTPPPTVAASISFQCDKRDSTSWHHNNNSPWIKEWDVLSRSWWESWRKRAGEREREGGGGRGEGGYGQKRLNQEPVFYILKQSSFLNQSLSNHHVDDQLLSPPTDHWPSLKWYSRCFAISI